VVSLFDDEGVLRDLLRLEDKDAETVVVGILDIVFEGESVAVLVGGGVTVAVGLGVSLAERVGENVRERVGAGDTEMEIVVDRDRDVAENVWDLVGPRVIVSELEAE